jgi:hypothetical protein
MPTPTQPEESFEFTLLRRQLGDDDGNHVTDDPNDPEQGALAEVLLDANTAPELLPVGHGRMTVVSHGDAVREFVRAKLAQEPEENTQYVEALVVMDPDAERPPAMTDLVAVPLPGSVAVLYEVVISWSDCQESAAHVWPEHADLDWKPCFTLARGHAILRRGPDLPLVSTGADDDEPEILGGSDAEH